LFYCILHYIVSCFGFIVKNNSVGTGSECTIKFFQNVSQVSLDEGPTCWKRRYKIQQIDIYSNGYRLEYEHMIQGFER